MSEHTYKTYREHVIELIEAVESRAARHALACDRWELQRPEVSEHFDKLQEAKVALINFICGEDE